MPNGYSEKDMGEIIGGMKANISNTDKLVKKIAEDQERQWNKLDEYTDTIRDIHIAHKGEIRQEMIGIDKRMRKLESWRDRLIGAWMVLSVFMGVIFKKMFW